MPVWQRNLIVIWAAEVVTIASFTMVFSFLPFHVQDLGVTEPQEVALWSGLLFTSRAVTMAIVAPIWGALGDRYGRKLMAERAMLGGAVILGTCASSETCNNWCSCRYAYDIPTGCLEAPSACPGGQRGDGRYSVWAAAELLKVSVSTTAAWCKSGRLDGIQAVPHGPWWIRLIPETIADLRKPVRRRWSRRPPK